MMFRTMSPIQEGIVPAFTPPPLPSDDKRWKIVNGTMRKNGFARHALIETLHTVQSSFGYLDDDAIRFVARSLRVPLSQAYGVVTFYHYFSLKPPGKHTSNCLRGNRMLHQGRGHVDCRSRKAVGHCTGADDQGRKHQFDDCSLRRCLQPRSRGALRRRGGRRSVSEQVLEQLERWTVE